MVVKLLYESNRRISYFFFNQSYFILLWLQYLLCAKKIENNRRVYIIALNFELFTNLTLRIP